MESETEPLRPASVEEIKQLIHIHEQSLPQSLQFLLILQNLLRVNKIIEKDATEETSHRVQKTVYIPTKGNFAQFATFVAISRDDDLYIMANSLQSPPYELLNAIQNTKYIKWTLKPVFVIGGAKEIRDIIKRKAIEFKLSVDTSDFVNYWLPRDEAAKLDVTVPENVLLKPLQKEHGKQINEWWPYKYAKSQHYIESAIQYNGGLGLFDKITGDLVACVFKNDLDGIAHLYTVPDRNNRGYGSALAKAMTRLIAVDHNQHVHTFISPNNEKSIRLFVKIGFSAVTQIQWLKIHAL